MGMDLAFLFGMPQKLATLKGGILDLEGLVSLKPTEVPCWSRGQDSAPNWRVKSAPMFYLFEPINIPIN